MPICCNLLSDGLKQYPLLCQFCNAKGKSCDKSHIISPSTQKIFLYWQLLSYKIILIPEAGRI